MKKQEEIAELLKWRYAHRGLHQKPTVPENSMGAFRRAVMEGFGIELDVHLTRDGRLAVIHDSSLKRTCGVDLNIEDMELAEAQIYFLEKSQERIPALEDVLSLVAGRVPLIVELKVGKTEDGTDTTEGLCRTAMKALDDYERDYGAENGEAKAQDDKDTGQGKATGQGSKAAGRGGKAALKALYCVESFSPVAVKWLRTNRPDVIRGQLAANLNRKQKTLPWMQDFLLKNLLVNWSGKPDFVAYCYEDREEPGLKRYQGPLFFWTIREYADLLEAEELGAAAIFEKFNPKEYEKK